MDRFYKGETIPFRVYFRKDGVLKDPGTPVKITIIDPDGTKEVDAEDMTKESTGKFVYNHMVATSGEYRWYIKSNDGVIDEWDLEVEPL